MLQEYQGYFVAEINLSENDVQRWRQKYNFYVCDSSFLWKHLLATTGNEELNQNNCNLFRCLEGIEKGGKK